MYAHRNLPPSDWPPELAALISGWVRVGSDSMAPWLQAGDEVRLDLGAPRLGDILLVPHEGQLLLHRLLRRDEQGLWLGGDATASREGPFPDQAWPKVMARRREGQVQAPAASRLARNLGWLAPKLVNRPLVRRLLARTLRLIRWATARRLRAPRTPAG